MRRGLGRLLGCGAAVAFLMGCFSFVAASRSYTEATTWFRHATYIAECTNTGSVPSGCKALSEAGPRWPDGIPVTNMDLLLAEAGAIHNTATAVLTLAGLFFAISGVLVAALAVPSARRLPARTAPLGTPSSPDPAES